MDAAASRDEQQAISLLAKLAKAPTLASFAMSSGDGMAYCGIHGKLAPVAVRNQEVLQAWFTTLSHGYRLFLAEQKEWANSSPKATVGSLDTLRHLTSHISWCLSSVVADMPHLAQAQFKMQVSRLFVQTGLLELLTSLCAAQINIINSLGTQQPQLLQERQRRLQQDPLLYVALIGLAGCFFQLLSSLANSWPGNLLLLTPALAAVLPTAAGLATAVFRIRPSVFGLLGPTDSILATGVWNSSTSAAANLSITVIKTYQCGAQMVDGSSAQAGFGTPLPSCLSIGSNAWELLLLHLGLVAQALHKQLKGLPATATTARQQQQPKQRQQQKTKNKKKAVPAFHEQLLAALGVENGGLPLTETLPGLKNRCQAVMWTMVRLLQYTITSSAAAMFDGSGCSSTASTTCTQSSSNSSSWKEGQNSCSASSSSSSSQQQQQQPLAWDASVVVPLHLTVLESMLLVPELATINRGLHIMICLLRLQTCAAVAIAPGGLQRLAAEVLPVLLDQLLPLVEQAEPAGDVDQWQAEQWPNPYEALADMVAVLTTTVMTDQSAASSSSSPLRAAFTQHTKQYCLLLEAALRSALSGSVLADNAVTVTAQAASQLLFLAAFDGPDSAAAAAAGGSSWLAAGGAKLQLFLLALTCLKANGAVLNSCSSMLLGSHHNLTDNTAVEVLQLTIWPCLLASGGILPPLECPGSMWAAVASIWGRNRQQPGVGGTSGARRTSSEANSHHNLVSSSTTPPGEQRAAAAAAADGMVRLWCVLLARCLVSVGKRLQQHRRVGGSRGGVDVSEHQLLACAVASCWDMVAWLKQQLPTSMTAAAADPKAAVVDVTAQQELPGLQPLLAQAEELLAKLECCRVAPVEHDSIHSIARQKLFVGGLQFLVSFAPVDAAAAAVLTQDAAALADLGQQLEVFGAAVCAQLPVQQCCNYHLCSNVTKRSELELVGGKSCVCGGCKTARYCSAACQKAHWRDWHRAVCKQLQQQQATQ